MPLRLPYVWFQIISKLYMFVPADPCSSGPCRNGGACIEQTNGEIKCNCQDGYYGERCELGRTFIHSTSVTLWL